MAKKPLVIEGKRARWYSARWIDVSGRSHFAHYGDVSVDAVRRRIYRTKGYNIKNLRIKQLKRRPKGW